MTISWMSRVPGLGVRTGVNRSLEWTLRNTSAGHRVSYWGPFRVAERLCQLAEYRISFLDSGRASYNLFDGDTRSSAFHCVHAVSDLDTSSGLLNSGFAIGDRATYLVAKHLAKWIVEPGAGPEFLTHPWLLKPLGLTKFPLVPRKLAHWIRQ